MDPRVAMGEGQWLVRLDASQPEYITPDRALDLAEELDAIGSLETAARLREAARTAMRFQIYAEA